MEENEGLQKQVAQLVNENAYMRQQLQNASFGNDASSESVVTAPQNPLRDANNPAGLLSIAEETLVEFLSKATGTAVDWVQMPGMKPGPDSIGIVAISETCSGVAARACGLEPTKIVEILKDRPSWFRDCRSLDVFTLFPVGNGGTIELVYMQMYAPTTLAPARDLWTLRYTTNLEDGSLVVCERSLSDSGGGPSVAASHQFVRAEMLPSGFLIRPCDRGGSIVHIVAHLNLEAWNVPEVLRPLYESSRVVAEKMTTALCSGIDENAIGASFQLVFAPIDELFPDDVPLLPSGFCVIPLGMGSKSKVLNPNPTLDLASSLEVGSATNRINGQTSPNECNSRSVLTIAFQFPYQFHLQESVAAMDRKYVRSIISSVQRVSMAITPSPSACISGGRLLPGSPEAVTLFVCTFVRQEKLKWIFSRVIESLWWQTLTPHMQSSNEGSQSSRCSIKKNNIARQTSVGNYSIELWKNAFNDACERLCPVRAAGHECGCLSIIAKLVMEQCVARLDVAMFNAILRESNEDIPTDPFSDPISDATVLPIQPGKLSFGAGTQLKNSIGNWSRWLTYLFGMDTDEYPDQPDNELHVIVQTSKSFSLLHALSDLLMLPKDLLLEKSIRKEVCPTFGASMIKRVLANFSPDEFCLDPIPEGVLEALDLEVLPSQLYYLPALRGERIYLSGRLSQSLLEVL